MRGHDKTYQWRIGSPLKHKPIMEAYAELKEARAIKSLSNDMILKLTFITDNMSLLDLAKYPADTLFKLVIEPEEGGANAEPKR